MRDDILFVKMNHDGFDLGAQRREIKQNDIPDIINAVKAYQNGEEISNTSLVTLADKKDIAEQDYILVGERYKQDKFIQTKWDTMKLCEVCDLLNGYAFKSSDYVEHSNTLNFRMSNIRPDGNVDLTYAKKYLPDEYVENYSEYVLSSGDVVIAMTDMASDPKILGVPTIIPDSNNKLLLNQRVGKFININTEILHIPFLKYVLNCSIVKDYYKSLSGGGLQINLSKKDLLNLSIPIPPLFVQKEIVEEIESYQKIIDGAKQIVTNYKPIINVDSGWELTTIGNICILNPVKSEVKEIADDTLVSFVPMSDISETDMLFTPQNITTLSEAYNGYTYFRDEDVLLAKVTPCFENGKSGIARDLCNGIGFGSSEFYVLRPDTTKVLPEFIYYTISSNRFINNGKEHMSGTGGLRRLTKDYVLNTQIAIPPLEIQKHIVDSINAEMKIIEQNKLLIEKFEQKISDKISEVWGE